jgi:hypothetical protein
MSDHGKAGIDKLKEIEHKLGLVAAAGGSKPPSPKLSNGSMGINSPEHKFPPKNVVFPGLFGSPNDRPLSGGSSSSVAGPKGYQCSFCSFSTPLLPLLFIHERSHSGLGLPPKEEGHISPFMHESMQPRDHEIDNQSESAVSLAKDQPPTSVASSSETPMSTPASTPVPSVPQDVAAGLKHELREKENHLDADDPPPAKRHCPTLPKPEFNNILTDLANITQRPALYALPQESGQLVMQSFLIEEPRHEHNNRFVPAVVFLPVKERIMAPVTVSFTLTPA